jgi:predicted RNA binding protein YcfA (HicA-like mRNA interferase family)
MKLRSAKNIEKALLKKGFEKISSKQKSHHTFYYFIYKGKRTSINTYLSHGGKSSEYGSALMNKIQHQLKFNDSKLAEAFLDCPFKEEQYISMLLEMEEIN